MLLLWAALLPLHETSQSISFVFVGTIILTVLILMSYVYGCKEYRKFTKRIVSVEAFKQELNLSGKETINEARDMIAKKQKRVVNKELTRLLRAKNYSQEFINAYKYCRNLSELNGLAFKGTLEGYMVKPEKSKLAYFVGEEDGIRGTYIGQFAVLDNKLIILNITNKRTSNLPRKSNEELR